MPEGRRKGKSNLRNGSKTVLNPWIGAGQECPLFQCSRVAMFDTTFCYAMFYIKCKMSSFVPDGHFGDAAAQKPLTAKELLQLARWRKWECLACADVVAAVLSW